MFDQCPPHIVNGDSCATSSFPDRSVTIYSWQVCGCFLSYSKIVIYLGISKFLYFNCLKLYCGYKYTRPCMINRIWGLKQLPYQIYHTYSHMWITPVSTLRILTCKLGWNCAKYGGLKKFTPENFRPKIFTPK